MHAVSGYFDGVLGAALGAGGLVSFSVKTSFDALLWADLGRLWHWRRSIGARCVAFGIFANWGRREG